MNPQRIFKGAVCKVDDKWMVDTLANGISDFYSAIMPVNDIIEDKYFYYEIANVDVNELIEGEEVDFEFEYSISHNKMEILVKAKILKYNGVKGETRSISQAKPIKKL